MKQIWSWCFPSSCTRVELTTLSATERYRSRGTPSLGQLRNGSVAMVFLKAKKACLQVSSHKNGLVSLTICRTASLFWRAWGRTWTGMLVFHSTFRLPEHQQDYASKKYSAFFGVGFYSLMHDHKAQELTSVNPRSIFFQVEAHVIFAELFKDLFQVCHMLGYALRLENHVVNIDLDVLFDLLLENPVHQSLVYSACIFKAEGHDLQQKLTSLVMNVVFSSSRECIWIWLYPEQACMKLSTWNSDIRSTSLSMLGKRYASLGHAL